MPPAHDKALFDKLRSACFDDAFLDDCASRLGVPAAEIRSRIETSLAEAAFGLSLLDGLDLRGKRVLEVGAGLGMVSLALHRRDAEVFPIEPGSGGFDLNARIGELLRDRLAVLGPAVHSLAAEDLRPEIHGRFDVIFSVNVLEHIPRLEAAVAALCGVLKPDGLMRHTCPNYVVPYEPHLGVALVPFWPRLTGFLLPGVRGTALWESLNFVTYYRVRRAFASCGFDCLFRPGLMYQSFLRLESDDQFRQRQGNRRAVATAYGVLRRTGLLRVVAALPPQLATPMTFEARPRS